MSNRRKTTRIYRVKADQSVQIVKEWAWAPKAYWWFVMEYGPDKPQTLGKFASFAEAKNFVRAIPDTHAAS